jgi:hypothetical protein
MKPAYFNIIMIILIAAGVTYAQSAGQANSSNYMDLNLTPAAYQQVVSTIGVQTLSTAINNSANIQQVGNFNQATINQINSNGLNPNIASIVQNNDYNQAQITQNGNGNNNSIIQNGNGNQAEINVTGDNNNTQIIQTGDNNVASQNINTSATQYIISQMGNNNSIQRYDDIQSPKAYIISQVGNSMHLIISTTSIVK